jgi:LysM repeat protein
VYYRVVRGDNLARIAARYGVSVWQVARWNGIANIDRIYAGSVLVIYPARCAQPAPRPKPQPVPPVWPAPQPMPPMWPAPQPVPPMWPVPPTQPVPPTWPAACTDQRAVIASPGNGAHVAGMATITGNAVHDNFKFYKLEYGAGSNPSDWHWFFGGEWPIWHGTLGVLNTDALPSGTYSVRVTVVDKTSNYPPPCQVTIVVR